MSRTKTRVATSVVEAAPAQPALLEAFVAVSRFRLSEALLLPGILDDPDFLEAVSKAASMNGLYREDLLPQTAGRALPEGGGWLQVGDTTNVSRYARQIGATVPDGSLWYATDVHEGAAKIPVVMPYAASRTLRRDEDHKVLLPLRLVQIETPQGPVMLYPREYRLLDADEFAAAAAESTFHALADGDAEGVDAEQVFFLRARGIARDAALGMLAHAARTPRLGWFTPNSSVAPDPLGLRLEAWTWPLGRGVSV